jgi:hypothetical protein
MLLLEYEYFEKYILLMVEVALFKSILLDMSGIEERSERK